LAVVLNIGIILSFFLGILLYSKNNKSLTDNILSLWLVVIGIHLTSYFLKYNGYWEIQPHLIGITVPFPLLHGPFLYLYVKYSFKSNKNLNSIDYLHFAPAVLTYLYLIPFLFFYSAQDKIKVDTGELNDFSTFSNLLLIGFVVSGLSYAVISYNKLLQRKKFLVENFSFDTRINLNWLRYATISIGGMFVVAALLSIFRELLHYQFPFNADILFYSIIVAFVVYVGYSGIRQQDLFSNTVAIEDKQAKTNVEYKNSGLKTEVAKDKHGELLTLMKNDKPYLNPKLTLSELADKLAISSNYLSQIINQYEQKNFHDFINGYRVDEFIERAQSNNNYSLLAHAFDAGFNSKSSFNSVFKKLKSVTPSQYLSNRNK